MCGIVGIISQDEELTGMLMKEFLLQSQIRGRHATGIAYLNATGKVESFSQPRPASLFIKHNFPESKMMLGHTRYSTSDIAYNQPISNQNLAIVHNGIITQEAFENWERHFGYKHFKTKNDTELLLKCIDQKENPFLKYINGSIACGVLTERGIYCMRNNTRPLYYFTNEYFSGFASTEDIIKRSTKKLEIEVNIFKTSPFRKYFFERNDIRTEVIKHNKTMLFSEDQQ